MLSCIETIKEPMTGIDRDITQRFHDGDLKALEEIIENYQGSVFGIGLKLMGTVEDAKDYSQDVFVHAYEKRQKYDPDRPFEPWFYKLALNLGRQRLRKRREVPRSESMPVEMVEETAERSFIQGERQDLVRHALQKLKPKYRECLALRFEADMQLHEIAQTLGISLGTVKTRLRRGLMAFKEAYVKVGGLNEVY
ncbi:hypothetical protein CR164_00670 [Prosthecochloris marina]|uniref:RNA polymerase subunit sigma-24 n=2 Tax=Chlorobiaceae TaxID=191412 RepID=A0A317T9J7_9CHLB|nr:hypothetical protein CR164_00670 [Prosthecochloris marina]